MSPFFPHPVADPKRTFAASLLVLMIFVLQENTVAALDSENHLGLTERVLLVLDYFSSSIAQNAAKVRLKALHIALHGILSLSLVSVLQKY